MNRVVTTTVAALGLGGLAAMLLYGAALLPRAGHAAATPDREMWIETKWPFPMDQWGEGRAFQCKAADCGAELHLYIRPKIGFCSATTGVADDNELERLSDFDFMNGKIAALANGHDITIAWMKGRLRAYEITGAVAGPLRSRTMALSIAYNNERDAMVATAMLTGARPETAEAAVIAFLTGQTMLRWATSTFGL
jgi:hypothetical protein